MPKAKYFSFFGYKSEKLSSHISTSVSLCFAQKKKRVLLVDLSLNSEISLLFKSNSDWLNLLGQGSGISEHINSTTEPFLDFLGSSPDQNKKSLESMAQVSEDIFKIGPAFLLKEKFEDEAISNYYDFVIFNLPQEVNLLTLAGVVASQELFVLIDALNTPIVELYSVSMGLLNLARERFNKNLILEKAVPVYLNKVSDFAKNIQEKLIKDLFDKKLAKELELNEIDLGESDFFDPNGKPKKVSGNFLNFIED